MASDMFGDASLFEEFERERPHNLFIPPINVNVDTSGDRKVSDSDSDSDGESQSRNETESRESDSDCNAIDVFHSSADVQVESDVPAHIDANSHIDISSPDVVNSQHSDFNRISNSGYNSLKRYTQLLDTTRWKALVNETPCIEVLYQNNKFARKYREDIENFLVYLVQKESHSQSSGELPDVSLLPGSLTAADLGATPDQRKDPRLRRTHAYLGCSQIYDGFVIDTLGWPLVDNNPALTAGRHTTQYEQVYTQSLPCESEEFTSPAKPARKKAACFNCGEAHVLSQCPHPHNQSVIRENSRQFREMCNTPKLGLSSNSNKNDKRFERFRPGVYSDELRSALGLRPDQFPSFIYSMRLLGYPPGWSIEAKKIKSGLAMFDKHGKEVSIDSDLTQTSDPYSGQQHLSDFDVNKMIEYPGFTVEAPGFTEECHLYNMPPLQPNQLKSSIIECITQQEQERKRRLEQQKEFLNKRQKTLTESDMDLDTECESMSYIHPPLPNDESPVRPPLPEGTPPPTGSSRTSTPSSQLSTSQKDDQFEISDSMSLEDLQSKYDELRNAISFDDTSRAVGRKLKRSLANEISANLTSDDNTQSPSSPDANDVGATSPVGVTSPVSATLPVSATPPVSASRSIERSVGTPVEASVKPSLPDRSQFGTGIEDHIPFENLPEATGRFDKLRQMLAKLRNPTKDKLKK